MGWINKLSIVVIGLSYSYATIAGYAMHHSDLLSTIINE